MEGALNEVRRSAESDRQPIRVPDINVETLAFEPICRHLEFLLGPAKALAKLFRRQPVVESRGGRVIKISQESVQLCLIASVERDQHLDLFARIHVSEIGRSGHLLGNEAALPFYHPKARRLLL